MEREPLQKPVASFVQAGLVYQFGDEAILFKCNPFFNHSDVIERVESFFNTRLNMAKMCVGVGFKGTRTVEMAICS